MVVVRVLVLSDGKKVISGELTENSYAGSGCGMCHDNIRHV
jgi:hypothetical protein